MEMENGENGKWGNGCGCECGCRIRTWTLTGTWTWTGTRTAPLAQIMRRFVYISTYIFLFFFSFHIDESRTGDFRKVGGRWKKWSIPGRGPPFSPIPHTVCGRCPLARCKEETARTGKDIACQDFGEVVRDFLFFFWVVGGLTDWAA